MSLHGAINIPPPGLSMGADIYGQYRRGEIPLADYLIFTAAMVADHAHEEHVRIYSPMPSPARNYVEGRLFRDALYDPALSQLLGKWRFDSYQALDNNQFVHEHFVWALSIVDGKLGEKADKLRHAIARFEGLKFPTEPYLRACDVLKMDAEEKQKKARQTQ